MVVKIPKDEKATPLPSSVSPRVSPKLDFSIADTVTLLFAKFLCVLFLLIWGEENT